MNAISTDNLTISKSKDPLMDTRTAADNFKVVAIISAYNEADVIYHVIGDLIQQGIKVYLLNHCSTDSTFEIASKWLGNGLLHIENFPQDAGYSERNKREYIWSEILKRKQELAHSVDADWFIHHDADEFRESPWLEHNLYEAIRYVDSKGYNAIDFELLNFRPVNNSFVPGTDVRESLLYYEGSESGNELQVKAWKKQGRPVDLVSLAGHSIVFEGRKVFPIKFILRHYPVRSQAHGLKKVLQDRKARFNSREIRAFKWHTHYNGVADENHNFIYDPSKLQKYDPDSFRLKLLTNSSENMEGTAADTNIQGADEIFRQAQIYQNNGLLYEFSQKSIVKEGYFIFHDCIDILKSFIKTVMDLVRRHD